MTLGQLINLIKSSPDKLDFEQVMSTITEYYHYTPACFTNGLGSDLLINEAGANEGSCKIFAFGQLAGLNESQTLACFGKYYREDVLANPEGSDHANIRTFIRHGWAGIHFDGQALTVRE